MKAAILTEINKELEVWNVDYDSPKLGQVLVKNIYSGLCGAQLQEIAGLKGNAKFVPHLLGHEGCGIVIECGEGVNKVSPGDKVIMHWRKGSGIESTFPTYKSGSLKLTGGKITTLSEFSVVSENRITKVPHNSNEELCTLLGCSLSTALGVVNYDANIKFGEDVLIVGCGGVGMHIVNACKYAGANNIYIIERSITGKKQQFISKHGILTLVDEIPNIDCIIDTTGKVDIVSKAMTKLNDGGRLVLISQPIEAMNFLNAGALFSDSGKKIIFSQGGGVLPDKDFPRYLKFIEKQKYNFDFDIFTLEKINEAINFLRSGNATRILIKF
jgi:S-(hydroxymethyl)glutathione dehydrogenase/alcohol dehydrogenase